MRSSVLRVLVAVLLAGLCFLALAEPSFAQCAMCRASVPQALAKNLNLAVIVLLAPPVSLFAAIFFIAFRNRKG